MPTKTIDTKTGRTHIKFDDADVPGADGGVSLQGNTTNDGYSQEHDTGQKNSKTTISRQRKRNASHKPSHDPPSIAAPQVGEALKDSTVFTYVNPFDQLSAQLKATSLTGPSAEPIRNASKASIIKPTATASSRTQAASNYPVPSGPRTTDPASTESPSIHRYNLQSKDPASKVHNKRNTTSFLNSAASTFTANSHSTFTSAVQHPPPTVPNPTLGPATAPASKPAQSRKKITQDTTTPTTPKPPKTSTRWTPRGSSQRPLPLEKMAIPTPSSSYTSHCTSVPARPSPTPRQLLIILDINGTLGYRTSPKNLQPRPFLSEFLAYLFAEHKVMIWTSMQKGNVERILAKILTKEQREELVGCWTREDLRLGRNFGEYVQTYKRLGWVWGDEGVNPLGWEEEGRGGEGGRRWGVGNTVLVDDSWRKAVSEPWNHVVVSEWEGPGRGVGLEDRELLRVREVLEEVRRVDDVARGIYGMRVREGLVGDVSVEQRVAGLQSGQVVVGRDVDGVARGVGDLELEEGEIEE
ncbi:hypothetical protein B9Z65_7135 [Elsinoe australis]|uniref:Mitochondrial import inner membrane translocase subunit TIM50 n=1 Tax=Elsinoe australis TaxID=40998 RepID=A0A2P7Z5Z2_9PEZI|nr:hypothetical protein B9Z65_7135 [Elsinoe australis]